MLQIISEQYIFSARYLDHLIYFRLKISLDRLYLIIFVFIFYRRSYVPAYKSCLEIGDGEWLHSRLEIISGNHFPGYF